jgi:hypothetical protein
MWEGKSRYVDKLMQDNAQISTLTEEQHDVLRRLCKFRHDWHTTDLLNLLSPEYSIWKQYDEISDMLSSVDLPKLVLPDSENFPSEMDYYELLDPEEREQYEDQATDISMHNGFTLWLEESGIGDDLAEMHEDVNVQIEDYLRQIDKIHGTHYCPTGMSRF